MSTYYFEYIPWMISKISKNSFILFQVAYLDSFAGSLEKAKYNKTYVDTNSVSFVFYLYLFKCIFAVFIYILWWKNLMCRQTMTWLVGNSFDFVMMSGNVVVSFEGSDDAQ